MSKGKTILFLSSTTHIFIDSFSIGIAIVIAEIFGKAQKYIDVGFILASFTIATAIAEPLWGFISDITQKRGFIVSMGLLGASFFFSLFPFYSFFPFSSVLYLSIVSLLTGLFAGTYHSVATTLLNENVSQEKRGFFQGINNAGGSLGRMAAPFVLSLLIVKVSFFSAFLPYIFLGIPVGVISLFLYPKIKTFSSNRFSAKKWVSFVDRFIILLMIISFLRTAFFLTAINFLPSFLIGFKKFDSLKSGYIMTFVLASGIIAQPLGGKISDYSNRSLFMTILLFASGFSFMLFIFSPFGIGLIFLAFSFFSTLMTFPILFAIIGDEIPKENMGFLTGLVSGAGGLSAATFQIASGIISERFSPTTALFVLSLFPLLSAVASLFLRSKPK
ncbi:MAG: MFS transporter [Acidobacteriota bacterium]|nr:MFS transporter [Thermoanaerobaculaceae bacterium]